MTVIKRLLALLLSLFGLISEVPAQSQGEIPADAVTYGVTVMSYNVYVSDLPPYTHAKRADGVIKNILSADPDVLGLQEANPDWMDRVSSALTGYAFVGVGRDDGKNKGEYSPVFYKKDKYELINGGTFWFSETPDKPSATWSSAYKRICSWAVLKDRETGFTFAAFNSHWDHISVPSRNNSSELLLSKIEEYAPDLPVVIIGDFNCKAKTVAYKTLIDGGFVDAMYTAPEADTVGSFHGYTRTSTEGELPIDHILFKSSNGVADTYRVITDRYDGMYPSDHFPIVAELTLF